VSNLATIKLGDIADENKTGLRLMQIYILKNRGYTETLIKMAETHGFAGLVVTVDAQKFGKRIIDVKNNFSPDTFELEIFKEVGKGKMKYRENDELLYNESFLGNLDESLDWTFIDWMRKLTKLPIILKGIMSMEDALKADKFGVDAVWISNHGGRQLDTVLATAQILPRVTSALKSIYKSNFRGQVKDGNIRRWGGTERN
jgi:isopentenyl diphosphate isomerase/L-lactate dehydrogenase-like FMN-dependent dehydrogenase